MPSSWSDVWRFRTKHLTLTLSVRPEPCDPQDWFPYNQIAGVEQAIAGGWGWFRARIQAHWNGQLVGQEFLHCASYANLAEFRKDRMFFLIVSAALRDARISITRESV